MALNHPVLFDGSMLLAAGSSLYYAIQGVKTGETFVARGLHAKRSDHPILFWFGIVQFAAIAITFVLVMIFVQL